MSKDDLQAIRQRWISFIQCSPDIPGPISRTESHWEHPPHTFPTIGVPRTLVPRVMTEDAKGKLAQIFMYDKAFDYFVNSTALENLLGKNISEESIGTQLDLQVFANIPDVRPDGLSMIVRSAYHYVRRYRGPLIDAMSQAILAIRKVNTPGNIHGSDVIKRKRNHPPEWDKHHRAICRAVTATMSLPNPVIKYCEKMDNKSEHLPAAPSKMYIEAYKDEKLRIKIRSEINNHKSGKTGCLLHTHTNPAKTPRKNMTVVG